jgi:Protein of unknown function (DUF3363)
MRVIICCHRLDRQLVGRHRGETAPMGFGHQVEKGLERRRETLIAPNLAFWAQDGAVSATSPTSWPHLQRRELDRAGERLAASSIEQLTYVPARDGATIRGVHRGAISGITRGLGVS